ncbi:MAG TPA: YciI family protein [Trebonia sp.]|nr:YciI family protein [Trebonia sp.]
MSDATRYVLFYEAGDNFPAGAREHFPAHQARYQEFMRRGVLLMLGPFADEPVGGALAIFTSREAAEEFASQDPFVLNQVVGCWHIRQWQVALPDRPDRS